MTLARLFRRPLAVCAFLAVAALSGTARADRVALKTGETVLGRVVTDRSNESILVVEDYVAGGLREFSWDAVTDADAERIRIGLGIIDAGYDLVKGESIVFRLNTGTGEIRGLVEKVEGGFLFVRNASMKEPQKIAVADVVSREPIEMEPQEIRTIAEVFEARKAEKNPDEAKEWFLLAGFGERIGAYEQAKEAYEAAAADETYLQRDAARAGAARMGVLIADKSSFDELRELRIALGANLWKRVREATDTFGSRHPEAGDAVKKKLEELKTEFTKKRLAYFAGQTGTLFEKVARRLIDLKVRPKDAAYNDIQAWIRSDALKDANAELLKQLQLRDPAVVEEDIKTFFDARPKKANGWRRVSYDSGSFLIEPAKIKPPSGQPKQPSGSKKNNNNSGPQVTIPVPKPPTRDTWWPAASGEVRSRYWWATFVEKNGLYEVQPKHDRVACLRCDAAGKLSKVLTGGGTLEYLCERCGGSQYDQIVVYR
jgi:hypothetical protein